MKGRHEASLPRGFLVGAEGFEPTTLCTSSKCSPPELRAFSSKRSEYLSASRPVVKRGADIFCLFSSQPATWTESRGNEPFSASQFPRRGSRECAKLPPAPPPAIDIVNSESKELLQMQILIVPDQPGSRGQTGTPCGSATFCSMHTGTGHIPQRPGSGPRVRRLRAVPHRGTAKLFSSREGALVA